MKKLLIANRGEIALRILRTARSMGFEVGIVQAPGDADGVAQVFFPRSNQVPVESYLNSQAVVQAAKNWGADFVHPGYGFLSENADFARQVHGAGIGFVGPTPAQMEALGDKENSKKLAIQLGVPTLQAVSFDHLHSPSGNLSLVELEAELREKGIGGPWLVKASGGGGGRGMRVVHEAKELPKAVELASREALAGFGNPAVFIERYLDNCRHIEVQVFGDGSGGGVAFGERECSLQRRHQKVVEEAPSAVVNGSLREIICGAAMRLVKATNYRGAGTVEFLLLPDGSFNFLEMNTRLQVEHPVTEEVYGVDLVQAQLLLSLGQWPAHWPSPELLQVLQPLGHAIEVRILAEDPHSDFCPTPGQLIAYGEPPRVAEGTGHLRLESGLVAGARVNPGYDSMVAKLIGVGQSRAQAAQNLVEGLGHFVISGFETNIDFLRALVSLPQFQAADFHTRWLESNLDLCFAACLRSRLESFFVDLPRLLFIRETLLSLSPLPVSAGFWVKRTKTQSGVCNVEIAIGGHEVQAWARGELADNSSRQMPQAVHAWMVGIASGQPLIAVASSSNHSVLYINIQGVDLSVDMQKQDAQGIPEDFASSAVIRSPMPGKIVEIFAHSGQSLARGDVILMMESMKMQIEIKATVDGHLQELFVTAGQGVEAGSVLANIQI